MKRILVTGKNSYIGDNFTQWMNQWPDNYQVIQESLIGQAWKQSDWSVSYTHLTLPTSDLV